MILWEHEWKPLRFWESSEAVKRDFFSQIRQAASLVPMDEPRNLEEAVNPTSYRDGWEEPKPLPKATPGSGSLDKN